MLEQWIGNIITESDSSFVRATVGCGVPGGVLVPATQCSARAAIQAAAHVHEIMFSPMDPIPLRFARVF